MDYMFMNERTDDYNFPILVLHDSEREGVWAIFVKRKGNYSEYVSKRIAEIVNWLGYTKVVFKTDQEPAIKDVMHDAKTKIWKDMDAFHEQVKNHCACQITVLHSPVRNHKRMVLLRTPFRESRDRLGPSSWMLSRAQTPRWYLPTQRGPG